MAKRKSKSRAGSFFLGAAIGAIAGILSSPKTRADLTDKAQKATRKGKKALATAEKAGKKIVKDLK